MRKTIYLAGSVLLLGLLVLFFGLSKVLFSSNDNNSNVEIINQVIMESEYISLPAPSLKGTVSIEESIHKRRSVRSYSSKSLSLGQVSQILWSAYGISDSTTYRIRKLRTAPSAGATYPLEIYLMVGDVEGLAAGLYRYLPERHSLKMERAGDIRKAVADACLEQNMLHEAPASLVYSAVYSRTVSRYGERGAERYVCMDLGHSAQNVYLQATALGMGTCAIGAFDDEQLLAVIGTPAEEKLLYLMPIGFPR